MTLSFLVAHAIHSAITCYGLTLTNDAHVQQTSFHKQQHPFCLLSIGLLAGLLKEGECACLPDLLIRSLQVCMQACIKKGIRVVYRIFRKAPGRPSSRPNVGSEIWMCIGSSVNWEKLKRSAPTRPSRRRQASMTIESLRRHANRPLLRSAQDFPRWDA